MPRHGCQKLKIHLSIVTVLQRGQQLQPMQL